MELRPEDDQMEEKKEEFIPSIDSQDREQILSKRQQKKLLKKEKFEVTKKLMRKREKDKMKQKRIIALEQGIPRSGPSRKALKRKKLEDSPADIQIAIDLSFDDLMIDKELSSCASQLLRVYTRNRRANRPIPLHFTGLDETGKLFEKLQKNDGWKNWNVTSHKEDFLEIFDKEKIIYLTSESENVLDELEKGAVYVIGGLVDHNHHKHLTHDIAQKNYLRTARLPLSEHLIIKTRTVLTINQVFDIILGISEGGSWQEVLMEALPKRKGIKVKDAAETEALENSQENEDKEAISIGQVEPVEHSTEDSVPENENVDQAKIGTFITIT